MLLFPKDDERVVFIGPTGSGKTTLARFMLSLQSDVVFVDFKHREHLRSDDLEAVDLGTLHSALDRASETGQRVVYRVPADHLLPQNARQLDYVAKLALERGDTLLYYDDLVHVARGNDFFERAPFYFLAVTTGREKHVRVWGSVQRPTWIPLVALSESDVRATFYLRATDDRKRVQSFMGEVPWDVLQRERHSFVMATDLTTTKPLRLDLRRAA